MRQRRREPLRPRSYERSRDGSSSPRAARARGTAVFGNAGAFGLDGDALYAVNGTDLYRANKDGSGSALVSHALPSAPNDRVLANPKTLYVSCNGNDYALAR